jgi:Zn finger protein HypA/HybF involved in hydrogenase expression
MVTNGPLIRPTVEGELPGHVFRAEQGAKVELEIGLTLSTRDRVSYLEIVKDGTLAHQVRLDEWAKLGGKLPPLAFHQSGWFVIRAVTDVADTYRFASTAPYYVEIGQQPRISKSSAQFFLDWLDERTALVQQRLDDSHQRDAVLKCHRQARAFWQDLVRRANAP